MGMFYDKIMESAEDVIQTPGDVGVDLDAVADEIMGNDGIEGHRDEVEAAVDGTVGDPVEEAAVIMYESQYNYNQLMRCIGITELQEAYHGHDFILEGANIKEFFSKVKDNLVKMFARITEVFKSVVNKLAAALSTDKNLATKYTDAIIAGCNKKNEWTFEGYEIKDINYSPVATDFAAKCQKALDAAKDGKEYDAPPTNVQICNAETKSFGVSIGADKDKTAASDMADALEKALFVKKKYGKGGASIDANTILDILKADRETKTIRKNYEEIKKAYKQALKQLKDMEKAIDGKYADMSGALGIAHKYIQALQYQKNVQHRVFAISLKAARAKRSQARHMALMWQKVGYHNGVGKEKDKKNTSAVGESFKFANII